MTITFTEASYENSIIELFQGMGYKHIYGSNVERDYTSPLHEEVLDDYLHRINPRLCDDAIKDAIYKLKKL